MRKGVTPLIATVLIVGIVVILAVFTIFSVEDLIGLETGNIEDQTSTENYCLRGVDLEIEPPCEDPVGDLKIKIKNRANGNLSGFLFQVVEEDNSVNFERDINLPAFGSKEYFLNFTGNYSKINKVIIVPKVASEIDGAVCSEVLLNINYVSLC